MLFFWKISFIFEGQKVCIFYTVSSSIIFLLLFFIVHASVLMFISVTTQARFPYYFEKIMYEVEDIYYLYNNHKSVAFIKLCLKSEVVDHSLSISFVLIENTASWRKRSIFKTDDYVHLNIMLKKCSPKIKWLFGKAALSLILAKQLVKFLFWITFFISFFSYCS